MQFFFQELYLLTRTQREKFQDMFLVKIASKGTSLKRSHSKNVGLESHGKVLLYVFSMFSLRHVHSRPFKAHGKYNNNQWYSVIYRVLDQRRLF